MSNTASTTSATMQSVLNAWEEFTRKFPPSRLPVSVRCNRAFIDELKELTNAKATVIGSPATANADGYACTLAEWVRDELASRESIDIKLLESLEFDQILPTVDDIGPQFAHSILRGHFWFAPEGELAWKCGERISIFKTAGRLIDFIDMVKDGAP